MWLHVVVSAPSGSTHHHTWPVLAKLQAAAEAWEPVAQRLAVVEGSSQLTVAQVRVVLHR